MKSRDLLVRFGGVFLGVLAIETGMWFSIFSFSDIFLWEPGVAILKGGAMLDLGGILPVHPGSTFLLASALLAALGIPEVAAMRAVMLVTSASLITLISYLCFRLRPQSSWWFFAAFILSCNKMVLDMTPPSALAALFFVVCVLLVVRMSEESHPASATLGLFGVSIGFLLATRIDSGAMLLLLSFPYLWYLAGRRAFIAPIFAALYFLALDPFVWVNPVEHALSALNQARANQGTPTGFLYSRHVLVLPAISVLLAAGFAALRPLTPLRRNFLVWLLGTSFIITGALLWSNYHPARYFFPLISLWEVLLPLFLLELVPRWPALLRNFSLSPEFLIFLWLFLDRFPAMLFFILHHAVFFARSLAIT